MKIEKADLDIALEILLELREDNAPDLSEALLRGCYFVQRNNQFSSDRSIAMAEMEKLIDAEVENLSADTSDTEDRV